MLCQLDTKLLGQRQHRTLAHAVVAGKLAFAGLMRGNRSNGDDGTRANTCLIVPARGPEDPLHRKTDCIICA